MGSENTGMKNPFFDSSPGTHWNTSLRRREFISSFKMFAFSACPLDCFIPENPRGLLTNCSLYPLWIVLSKHWESVHFTQLSRCTDKSLASFKLGVVTPHCGLKQPLSFVLETCLNLEKGENKRPHNVLVHNQSALYDSTTQGKQVCDGASWHSLLDPRVCAVVDECLWCSSLYSEDLRRQCEKQIGIC